MWESNYKLLRLLFEPPAKLIFLVPLTTQRHAQKPNIKQHTEVFFVSFVSTATASEVRGELKVGGEKKIFKLLKKNKKSLL